MAASTVAVPKRHSSVSRVLKTNNLWYVVVMVLSPYRTSNTSCILPDRRSWVAYIAGRPHKLSHNRTRLMISPRNEACSNSDSDADVLDKVRSFVLIETPYVDR